MLKIVPQTGAELHRKLLEAVLGAKFSSISGVDSGDLMNRFNQDLMFIDSSLPLHLLNTVSGLLMCIVQLVLVLVPAIYMLAILPLVGLILFCTQHFYLRTSTQLRHLDLQSKAALHTKVSELCEGLLTIRAHRWQRPKHLAFLDKLDSAQRPFYLLYMIQVWLQLVLNLTAAALCTAMIGVSVALRNSTSASGIGLAMLNLVTLGQSLENFLVPWTQLETSLAAISRIESFQRNTPQEQNDAASFDIPPKWPSEGKLECKRLWVTYAQHAEKPRWALQDISLQVRAGEKIAICGQSGSGKSTLLLSMLRLIEPTKGDIVLDDINIKQVSQRVLRSRVVVVPQDPFLHGSTIRAAADPRSLLSEDELRTALQTCGLLGKIDAAGGLDSQLSSLSLSTGETQLFVLARTIVNTRATKGGVLLLDESTSGYVTFSIR